MKNRVYRLESKLLTATREDRVAILLELAWELRTIDVPRMRQLAREAQELAIGLASPGEVADSLAVLARADLYDGRNDAALDKVLEALAMMDQNQVLGDPRMRALATLASIYMNIDTYAEVLEVGQKLLQLAQQIEHVDFQITALNIIGAAYSHIGNYPQALEQYALALPLCKVTNNRQMEGVLHLNQVLEYTGLQDYDTALLVGNIGLNILEEVGIPDLIVSALNRLGETYLLMEDYSTALHYFHEAYTRAQQLEVNAEKLTGSAATFLGRTYLKQGLLNQAETYLQQALMISQASNFRQQICCCHKYLSEVYEQQGGFQQALEYYQSFHRIKEEIFNERNTEKVNLLMIVHQTEQLKTLRENDRRHFECMSQMKDELIESTSHDLKNPLSIMKTTLGLMERKQPLRAEDWKRYHERLLIQIERMRMLIANLLDLAALESPPTHFQPISITPLIYEILRIFEVPISLKRIELVSQIMSENLYVAIEEQHFQRIVENLLSNAIKYTPEGGSISLVVNTDQQDVYITVQDTGIGIPEQDQPFIFEKFYRVKTPIHSAVEGSGLGLSIVKKIVERYHGTIRVESCTGEGSLFEVVFPLWKATGGQP